MSGQIEYNQMPREPAPAVLLERSLSAEQPVSSQPEVFPSASSFTPSSPPRSAPRPNQPMTMDRTMNLRGGGGDGG
ncbi:hypothetical protein CSHISOI_02649, partial [Colletotrichum shisoi]